MQSRPPELSDSAVAAAVSEGWQLPPSRATYRPVGYGSHHWSVDDTAGGRWFASVDVLAEESPEASFDPAETADTGWSWDAFQTTLDDLAALAADWSSRAE